MTKNQLPALAKHLCTLLSGAGVGMFLAVAFVPEDDRRIFHIHYYVTAWLLALGGTVLRNTADLFQPRKSEQDLVDENHVA